jgi:tetratricopeptide (TPR) repeat protein
MVLLPIACLCTVIAAQAPATVDALRRLAAVAGNEAALAAAARAQPDSLRLALSRTFARAAAAGTDRARAAELATAWRLAESYARAWADSFLVRQVAGFARSSPEQRVGRVAADSLRREGIDALGREGVPAAMALWREGLARVPAADTAGLAAALASIGAGFYVAGELDSATVYLTRARDIARAAGDHRTLGNAIGVLASVSKDRGDLARAAALYDEASAVRERSGDRRGIAVDQNNLGLIAHALGDLEQARRAFERALDANRRDGRSRPAATNLTNLADIASLTGTYRLADSLYREALAINRADGDVAETAFVLHRMGLLASRRGDYAKARTLLAEALRIHDEAGAVLEAAAVRGDLAAVQAATGELQAALTSLGRAERDAEAARDMPALQASLALARADLAVQLGAFADAEAAFARAERLYGDAGWDAGRAEAQHGRALLLHLREDHAGALRVLEQAAATQRSLGDRRGAAVTQVLAGHVQRETGDTAAARRTLTAAHATLRAIGDAAGEAAALAALGRLAADRGATLAAEELYRRGLETIAERPAIDVRWQLHAGMAEALRSRGALGAAAEHLRAAVASLEAVAGGLRLEERRVGFLADKWTVYASLARVERERGRLAEAFAASEQLRARQLRDLLARGRVPARREVSRREQDLRRRITELLREIETDDAGPGNQREAPVAARTLDAATQALARAQQEYGHLLLDLRENDPAYAELVEGETVSWTSVAAHLEPHEALLAYLVADSGSTVFVVTSDTIAAIELNVRRAALANLVAFARRAMDRPGSSPAVPLWRPPLRRLYQQLVEPVEREGLLDGKTGLVIAPHGELHFLPFAALLDTGGQDHFLIERFEIA